MWRWILVGGPGHTRLNGRSLVCGPSLSIPPKRCAERAALVGGVAAIRGRGEALPIRSEAAGLVFLHNSLHYLDWPTALQEVHRVLRPGAWLWIWTLGPDHHTTSNLAQWFPSVAELDIARFPDPEDVLATLRAMGFERVDHQADNEVVTRGVGAWLAAADAGFISTLQLVDPEEKRRGIRAFSAIHTDQSATFSYTIRFTLMMAMRP